MAEPVSPVKAKAKFGLVKPASGSPDWLWSNERWDGEVENWVGAKSLRPQHTLLAAIVVFLWYNILRTAEPRLQRMPSRVTWSAEGNTDSQPNAQSTERKSPVLLKLDNIVSQMT